MKKRKPEPDPLSSSAGAKAMDAEASAEWGLDPFALVEAAGRECARAFVRHAKAASSGPSSDPSFTVLAGTGNNAADALVMLRALILAGRADPGRCLVLSSSPPEAAPAERTPLSQAKLALRKLGVEVQAWANDKAAALKRGTVIDGIAGTGLEGPLRGRALEMALAANALGAAVVSIDVPSGGFDGGREQMPMVSAGCTLAIQPRKLCLYAPAVRPHAGRIIPVNGIFPSELVRKYGEAELVAWESSARRIRPVEPHVHKYGRGLVEIWAGSHGAAGAARLAALGAQAAGAGIVRLVVDSSLYPILAGACSGIMVAETTDADAASGEGRFVPSAMLLGPGWGKGEDRMSRLENALAREKLGLPLVLDADAIALAKNAVFHGNAILTPHVGEFAACTGLAKDEILADPVGALRSFAAKKRATVLLKSHVTYVASFDGRVGVIDGMNPALAAGGSGDVLAGFCAAIAARSPPGEGGFDGYSCACAAAALLARSAEPKGVARSFADPAEFARAAAAIAGKAWIRRAE